MQHFWNNRKIWRWWWSACWINIFFYPSYTSLFLHIKGFVNSGYGVNGMAHVSRKGILTRGMFLLCNGFFFQILGCINLACVYIYCHTKSCSSASIQNVCCEKSLKHQKSESFSCFFDVIPNLVYQRRREQWQEFCSSCSMRNGGGGWLAFSFTCCRVSPDTASGAISRLHESQKTRTLCLNYL